MNKKKWVLKHFQEQAGNKWELKSAWKTKIESLAILMFSFEATRGLFWVGTCNRKGRHLSRHHLSKLPDSRTRKRLTHDVRYSMRQAHIYCGSSVESDFEPGALRP
ncbi:hypothetical protein AVEN_25623-1 [Araneus ventricosus]|uniref:Uncharacterized protein n=1 Tax=Araneus ventricosus TaxID=182803 RepID=A0A4Y2BQB2_ARAVE|nr:hypothetical protein AVEN_25623-1 [Araneus ventricosus]